jgi:hypothetical protein
MKIVQSYWSPATSGLGFAGGWLSAEYHWQSWALSVLQLRQFYDEVELVTDTAGKALLIDTLGLPYTSVRVVFDEALAAYPHDLWALAKIYAYSIQNEPFLHIDGDVYIWKRFEPHIENAPLVAQNFEVDFPFYQEPLRSMQEAFNNVPTCMLEELNQEKSIFSSNTGVIGGHLIEIFQEYKHLAFGVIDDNVNNLHLVEVKHFNICFEQFLYYCLAKEKGIPLSYIIDNQGQFDPSYPNFADFHKVPCQTWYVHCMAEYKRQEVVVQHLAKRLRQDYPTYYYRILRACQSASLSLHSQVYNLPELSLNKHDNAYFSNLEHTYQSFAQTDIRYFYGKSIAAYRSVEALFSLPFEAVFLQTIVLCTDVKIKEETEPTLKQTLHVVNLLSLQVQERILDNLDMILYDVCAESKTISKVIDEVGQYFPKAELEADMPKFQNLVLERIKVGLYLGVLWVA